MPRILHVAHGHMNIRPGGMEAYAGELCDATRDTGEFETLFVSRAGRPQSVYAGHGSTRLGLDDHEGRVYYFHTERSEFDPLLWDPPDKRMYTRDWRAFLEAVKPDIIHFHHHILLGYQAVLEARRTLPNAVIVDTLHDFTSICANQGQMVKTRTHDLCNAASPRRCHECFPKVPAATFFLRERFIKAAFAAVDQFIVPSKHARKRYIEWGIPPERIIHEDYGRVPVGPLPDPPGAGRRRRVGFFGRITPFKGVEVLLEAMKLLEAKDVDVRLSLWGSNVDMESPRFRERFDQLLEAAGRNAIFHGGYDQSELPMLMSSVDWVVVPSIWWETGPLVIWEALMHRRPVICTGIGSMAERIDDGVNGLHFRVRDPDSLADAIQRAVESPELWDKLRGQLSDLHTMEEHLQVVLPLYHRLLAERDRAAVA